MINFDFVSIYFNTNPSKIKDENFRPPILLFIYEFIKIIILLIINGSHREKMNTAKFTYSRLYNE